MHVHAIALLRAIHILAGALWVGAALFNAAYLIPSVIAAGPAGGQVMRTLVQVRRLPVYMNTVMAVTLLSGIALYGWTSNGFSRVWLASSAGITLTGGALLALVVAGIGFVVTVPTVKRIGALGAAIAGAGGPPSPAQAAEMASLQRRMLGAARLGATLLVVATLAMAMARYL
jgi:uncharacterized membrane protein